MQTFIYVDRDRLMYELALKDVCTCPGCHTVWAHKDSKNWIVEHFGSRTQPVTCPECGTQSVAPPGKYLGPRKVYQEPVPEPGRPRLEQHPPKRGWFGRNRAREEANAYEYQR